MKKLGALALMISTVFLTLCTPAKAMDIDTAVTSVSTAIQAGLEGYDISVLQRMVGRAGASTVTGSKGIAFEIKLMDKMNWESLFKNMVTSLENSSTNTVSDLVSKTNAGEVVDLIQCKAATSESGINQIVNQVSEGKYESARLVGTSECAKAFNVKAANEGLAVTMEDSGISARSVEQTAERFLNPGAQVSQTLSAAGKAGAMAAVVRGGIAAIESVRRGDSPNELIGHVMTEVPKGMITGAAACMAGDGAVLLFTVAGVSNPVVLVIGGIATSIMVATPIEIGLDNLADKFNVESTLTEWVAVGTENIINAANSIREKADAADIAGYAAQAIDSVKASATGMWNRVVNIGK